MIQTLRGPLAADPLIPGERVAAVIDRSSPVDARDELDATGRWILPWTWYAGWELEGQPVLTMLRGTVIARDGEVLNAPGGGRPIRGVAQRTAVLAPGQLPGLALEPA